MNFLHQDTHMTPFGSGYTLAYGSCDGETLRGIRDFQSQVAAQHPEWTTRLDYGPGSCRLHVFPVNELPGAIFSSAGRYGRH